MYIYYNYITFKKNERVCTDIKTKKDKNKIRMVIKLNTTST